MKLPIIALLMLVLSGCSVNVYRYGDQALEYSPTNVQADTNVSSWSQANTTMLPEPTEYLSPAEQGPGGLDDYETEPAEPAELVLCALDVKGPTRTERDRLALLRSQAKEGTSEDALLSYHWFLEQIYGDAQAELDRLVITSDDCLQDDWGRWNEGGLVR